MSTQVDDTRNFLFALNNSHKTWDIRDKTQRNRLPRIRLDVLALCGTCRVRNLDDQSSQVKRLLRYGGDSWTTRLNVIITTLCLPNGILPPICDHIGLVRITPRTEQMKHVLLIDKGRKVSIRLLGTFEQFIAREAQQNLCIDRIRTHVSSAVGERLGALVQLGSAEDRVRVRTAGSAREGQEI